MTVYVIEHKVSQEYPSDQQMALYGVNQMTDETPDFEAVETEMRAFLGRLATTLVSASAQSKHLKTIQQDLNALQDRLNVSINENECLRKEMADVYDMIKAIETERDVVKVELAKEKEVVAKHEAIISFQAETIKGHEGTISNLRGEHGAVTSERDGLKAQLANAERDVDYWRSRSHNSEANHDRLTASFNQRGAHIHDLELEVQALKAKIVNVLRAVEDATPQEARDIEAFNKAIGF